jgi:pilus assembly protein TadC
MCKTYSNLPANKKYSIPFVAVGLIGMILFAILIFMGSGWNSHYWFKDETVIFGFGGIGSALVGILIWLCARKKQRDDTTNPLISPTV